jgi:hypothetical protein
MATASSGRRQPDDAESELNQDLGQFFAGEAKLEFFRLAIQISERDQLH